MTTSGDDKYPFENNPFEENSSDDDENNPDENKPTENNHSENPQQKKGKGRQKIKMEKIAKESNLQVTFSKRRAGLFKKANELSTLTGAENAIVVFSPGGKAHSFGHPNVETIANRFLNTPLGGDTNPLVMARNEANMRQCNQELTNNEAQLAQQSQRNRELKNLRKAGQSQNWAPPHLDELNHEQLDQLTRSIMNLKQNFDNKVRNATNLRQGSNPGAGVGGSGPSTTQSGPTMGFPMGSNVQGQGPSNFQFPSYGQYRAPVFPDGSINPAGFGAGAGNMIFANQTNPSGSSLLPSSHAFVNPFDPNIGNYQFMVQYPHMAGAPSGSNVVFPPYNYSNPIVPYNINIRPRSSNVEPDGEDVDSHETEAQNNLQGSNKDYGRAKNP